MITEPVPVFSQNTPKPTDHTNPRDLLVSINTMIVLPMLIETMTFGFTYSRLRSGLAPSPRLYHGS